MSDMVNIGKSGVCLWYPTFSINLIRYNRHNLVLVNKMLTLWEVKSETYHSQSPSHGYIQQKDPLLDHSEQINAAILDQNLRIFLCPLKYRIKRCNIIEFFSGDHKNMSHMVKYRIWDVGYNGVKCIGKIGVLPGPSKLCRTTRIIGYAGVG